MSAKKPGEVGWKFMLAVVSVDSTRDRDSRGMGSSPIGQPAVRNVVSNRRWKMGRLLWVMVGGLVLGVGVATRIRRGRASGVVERYRASGGW